MDEATQSLHMMVAEIRLRLEEEVTWLQKDNRLSVDQDAILHGVHDALEVAEDELKALGDGTLATPAADHPLRFQIFLHGNPEPVNVQLGRAGYLKHPRIFGSRDGCSWDQVLMIASKSRRGDLELFGPDKL